MSGRYRGRLKNGSILENALNEEDGRHTGIVATTHRSIGDDEATARHLVACWNAVEGLGLTTEQLEAGVLRDVVEVVRDNVRLGDLSPRLREMFQDMALRNSLAKIGGTK